MAKISSAQKTKFAFLAFTITACTVIGLSDALAADAVKVMKEDVVCTYEIVGGEKKTQKVPTLSVLDYDVPKKLLETQVLIDANKRVNACAEFFSQTSAQLNADGSKTAKTTVNGTVVEIVKD